jgi:hypothetical protein
LSSKLTPKQRRRLIDAYHSYADSRLNELTTTVLTVVGIGIGTLSAEKIPAIANIIIMSIVLLVFLVLLLLEKLDNENELRIAINYLTNMHVNTKDNEEILEEINSYNIWENVNSKTFKTSLTLCFGVLFGIYTLTEHVLRGALFMDLMHTRLS